VTAWLAHPEWAVSTAIGVALAAACAIGSWLVARRRALGLLGTRHPVGGRRLARDLALVAALAALGLAWLGPRAGFDTVLVAGSGVDVVLLLDVSRSMDAADVAPSRLTRAREIAAALLERLAPEDRAALAAFAGRGVLLTPLTHDTDALSDLLPAFDGELLQERGSDLGAGVTAALGAFEAAGGRPRVVVALSDGEDPVAGRELGDEVARRAGARVVSVGLGSETGAAVPDSGVPLLDTAGRAVVSRRDAARLARLAEVTDGAFFAADRWGDVDLGAVAAAIRRDGGRAGAGEGELVPRRVAATHLVPLAVLAYALLWLEGLRRGATRRGLHGALLLLALGAVGAGPYGGATSSETTSREAERSAAALEARLREGPGDPRLLVELGVARAEAAHADEAARAFLAAALGAGEPELSALAYYDLGVLAVERRDLAAARDAFFDALALDPSDAQARFNLEWTLRALRAEPPKPPPAGEADSERAAGAESQARNEQADRAPDRSRDAHPQPAAPEGGDPARGFAPSLDAKEIAAWLDAVSDQANLPIQSAARGLHAPARPSDGLPQW
jgi:Ca-activated chloride channel homolog